MPWLEFRRYRPRGQGPARGAAYGFRITFERPVKGPIAIGHGGLGMFIPEERRKTKKCQGVELKALPV